MIGYGLNIAGAPKDYTSIVAARQRQKQLGELEEKKKRDSELEGIKKSLFVKPDLYMPYRLKELRDKGAEMVSKLGKAYTENDINTLRQEMADYENYAQILQKERASFDELQKQYQRGTLRIGVKPDEFYKAPTPEDAYRLAEASGGDYFRDASNAIGSNPVENIDIEKEIFRPAIASMNPYQSNEYVELIGPDGKKVRQYKQFYDQDEYERKVSTRYNNDPALQQLAKYNLKSRFDTSKLSTQEIGQKAKELFIDDAVEWMKREKYLSVSEKGRTQFNLNVNLGGDQQQAINQPMATDNVQIGTKRGVVDVPVFGSTATGDIVSTFPTSRDLFYTDDNEKVPGGAVTKATYNQVSVGIVANSDIKIPNDAAFLMDYNIPKSVKEYAGQTIKAGQLVDPELKDYLAARGKLRAAVITFGRTEDDYGIYRSASLVQQNSWFKANKQKSPEIENLFNTQKQIESDLTRMYSKGVTKTPKNPTGSSTGTPAPKAGAAAPAKLPTKKPNKYGI